MKQYTFQAAEPTQLLKAGDVLDLGNRAFEVLHLPGQERFQEIMADYLEAKRHPRCPSEHFSET